ncbi:hypothetical protein NPIL_185921 [Nephila pilipes]|uniref:Uncharacterized protein n=1 Tax=Nephila pilipes TaxID=299642 RepID=A0A8X6TJP4_NEPPI|nr:hypothetical protein NPIL_185921 [Nephila pilipes]
MDAVSQVLRNPGVQIANQQRRKTQQILATSVCIYAPQLQMKREGDSFQKTRLYMFLADSHKSEVEVYKTSALRIRLHERVIRTLLISLPYAKGNPTL